MSTQATDTGATAPAVDTADGEDSLSYKTITEGSTTMSYPADQESTVFYNPVQVQNRDLSILMIALHAERRAVRHAVASKKKEIRAGNPKIKEKDMQEQLDAYEKTLNGAELIQEKQNKITEGNGNVEEADEETGLTILDALAASGLRSIRYWKEIPGVKHVTINDLEEAAIQRAHMNVKNNNLSHVLLEENRTRKRGICIHRGDATHELYMSRRPQQLKRSPKTEHQFGTHGQLPTWDVIDLDPYGSAAPFLDGAVQAVENNGLLCITCTDMAALGGSHPETAYGRYAGLPIQTAKYLQEAALRILLYSVATSAARYGRTIRPILSVGMAFYVRVFVEIVNDKRGVSDLSLKIGNVYQSSKCSTFYTMPHGQMGGKKGTVYQSRRLTPSCCPETGAPFKMGGPIWLGPLHDQTVVQTALDRLNGKDASGHSMPDVPKLEHLATRQRILGLLTSVREEIDAPLYYSLPDLCKTLHVSSPPLEKVNSALRNAGYDVSGFHKEPNVIKTTAPPEIVWDVLREWVKANPPKKTPEEGSPAHQILSKEPSVSVDFSLNKASRKGTEHITAARFPQNPESHWGPKRRALPSGGAKRKAEPDVGGKPSNDDRNDGSEEPQAKRSNNGED